MRAVLRWTVRLGLGLALAWTVNELLGRRTARPTTRSLTSADTWPPVPTNPNRNPPSP